jgi:hypothetical protein
MKKDADLFAYLVVGAMCAMCAVLFIMMGVI